MDAFGDLLLTDPEDEQPDHVTSRQARIARAFDESKKSYSSEIVVTPPGWFQLSTPLDDITQLDGRHLEWSVQRLYLQRAYKQSQALALDVLSAAGDPALGHLLHIQDPRPAPAGILPKNEARDREMLDTAIRCAIHLDDPTGAVQLAEASRSRWTNNPGLGYTAGKALMFANKPCEAISALLHATRLRTPSHPVLVLLAQALHDASIERTSLSLEQLAILVGQYAKRTQPAFERGLFPERAEPVRVKAKEKASVPVESVVRGWATEAGLDEVDVGLIVALCSMSDTEGEDAGGERSVRSL
ncbi:hypothetical protein RSOLAG22IIIB_07299 [Rhizoctonia solani]|uniref:Uncharacterized protein n=1 Tax=Rhizoctonia solani TaxID=456999 RepID=A0A0K6FM65_9AGAM|nr:hypothetical protein RSOLAG22IIIB_07299 [Rhizoctonia solani]